MKNNKSVNLFNTPSPALRASFPSRGEGNNNCFFPSLREKVGAARMRGPISGFTLIELLVVVLIIGILAAVAVPQYQKTVEKSKATQALTLLKSLHQAQLTYFLAHGEYAPNFNELDVEIPWTGNEKWLTSASATDTRSNDDWTIQIWHNGTGSGFLMGRLSGPYRGAGFVIYQEEEEKPKNIIMCMERKAKGIVFIKNEKGSYCQKLFNGTEISFELDSNDNYLLP